jgi:antitoxin (DNA-binding transcriptional repressor) of toxin-antitoxin stability system
MNIVTLHDLQRDPAALLDRVEAGAELRPVPPARRGPRPFGLAAGAFTVPADFDAPLPADVLRDFEG